MASTIANCMGRGEGQEAFKPADFMPKFHEEEDEPDMPPEEKEKRKLVEKMLQEQLRNRGQ